MLSLFILPVLLLSLLVNVIVVTVFADVGHWLMSLLLLSLVNVIVVTVIGG